MRRTAVVGIFPERSSLMRLAGILLAEQDDEWAVTDRRYLTFESMARINEPEGGEPKELLAAIAYVRIVVKKVHDLTGRGPPYRDCSQSCSHVRRQTNA